MAELNVSELCKVLTDKKFDDDVVKTFRDNKIDGETFLDLDENDMKELGVKALGDRRKLKKLQQRFKDDSPQGTSKPPPENSGQSPQTSQVTSDGTQEHQNAVKGDTTGKLLDGTPPTQGVKLPKQEAGWIGEQPIPSDKGGGTESTRQPTETNNHPLQLTTVRDEQRKHTKSQTGSGLPPTDQSEGQARSTGSGSPPTDHSEGQARSTGSGSPRTDQSEGQARSTGSGLPPTDQSEGQVRSTGSGSPRTDQSEGQARSTGSGSPPTDQSEGQARSTGSGSPRTDQSEGQARSTGSGSPRTDQSEGQARSTGSGSSPTDQSEGQARSTGSGSPHTDQSEGQVRPTGSGPSHTAETNRPTKPAIHQPTTEPPQPPSRPSHANKGEKVKGYQYHKRLKRDGPPPRGLSVPSSKRSVRVVFHALVPQDIWQLSEQSHVHIRFEKPSLGNWNYDCGDFKRERFRTVAQQQVYEVTCELSIDASLLDRQQFIPYKYVIYSPRMEEDGDCWEYLYGVSSWGGIFNRCLEIPTKEFRHGEVYHQYDSMVYPQKRDKTTWQKLKGFLGGSEQEFAEPSPDTMRKDCLNFYLTTYQELLSEGNFPAQCDISQFIRNIQHIYNQIKVQVTIKEWGHSPDKVENRSLKVVMKEWLLSIVKTLKGQRGSLDHGKILASASIVAYLLKMVQDEKVTIDADDVGDLLDLLQVEPEQKSCPDFEYLCSISSEQCRPVIAQAIVGLCNYLIAQQLYNSTAWLTALPVYHFLRGTRPFSTLQLDPQKLMSADKDLKTYPLKLKAPKSLGFVKQHYDHLQHFIEADPLLLPVLVEVCPRQDRPELFNKISPYVSVTWLAKKTNEFDLTEIKSLVETVQQSLQKLSKEDIQSIEELKANVEAALFLPGELSKKLKGSDDEIELLKSSLSLLFFALWKLESLAPGTDESKQIVANTKSRIYLKVKGVLKDWIADRKVIGGSIFGGTVDQRFKGGLAKDISEINLWKRLLPLDCPDSLKEGWRQIVHELVQDRVNEVPKNLKVRLFCTLASTGDADALLSNIFVDAAMLSLEDLMTKKGSEAIQNVERLNSVRSKEVGKLLGHMIEKKYPDSKEAVSFRELLQWDLWPSLMKIYSEAKASSSIIIEGLPPNVDELCYCTQTSFDIKCGELASGDISFADLEEISKRQEQMEKLCAAALPTNTDGKMRSHHQMVGVVQKRLTELRGFQSRCTQLGTLCSAIPVDVVVEGLKQLKQCVGAEISQKSIKNLWDPNDGKIRWFSSAIPVDATTSGAPPTETQLDAPLVSILEPFNCIAGQYSSNFFHNTWKATLRSAGKNAPLTLEQMKTLWQQSLTECVRILSSLADYTLKLDEVDCHFITYQDKIPELSTELRNLAHGVNSCKVEDSKIPGPDVIDERVRFIQQYWELRNHASAADILLRLQKCLKLQGDFKPVEKISSQVTDSLNDATLESIKELLQHTAAARFLKGIASHRERRKCLETFVECMDLVEWIRKLEGGIQGIQKFVTVAIGTGAGGEGDLQHDKLSKLRTVSSGFESLIFRLPKDAGYQTVVERCESLWQALKQTPNLPTQLETCRRNLDWYEGVKMAQGSVEVTSFSQMKVINGNGLYTIGSFDSTINRSLQDVIHLELSETDKHTTQTTYALDELRDLESKLVLITGSESEGDLRDGVEQFTQTLHTATRIADVLIALQQAGHVKYIGWAMTFQCNNFKVDKLESLQNEAKEMEHELDNWKKEIERARKHFYDINCFTTLQLLTLRKELGKFNKQLFADSNVSPHALTLLQCLSPEISNGHIKPAVQNIPTVLPKLVPQLSIEAPSTTAPQPEEKKDEATYSITDIIVQKPEEAGSPVEQPGSGDEASESDEEDEKVPDLKTSLNEFQRFVLDKLVAKMGYNEQLVLKGLQNVPIDDSKDKYTLHDDVLEWCEDNQLAEEPVSDHSDDEESEDSSQESDYEENALFIPMDAAVAMDAAPDTVPPSTPADEPANKQPQLETASSKVKVIRRLPVGEHHPLVIELQQKVKFPVQDCIKAVRFCGEDREAAEEYLLATADKGELFLSDADDVSADSEKLSFMGGYGVPKEIGSNEGVMVVYQPDTETHYLNLKELAAALWQLSSSLPGAVPRQRPFKSLKSGSPNLIVTSPENMLRTTLALYMEEPSLPLPTQEEVLICTPETTEEQVTLLWRRAINDPDHKRIFCLVHPEKLPFQVSDKALRTLSELSQGKRGYRLAIICCDDDGKSHFVSKLHLYRKPYAAVEDVSQYQNYLKRHFVYSAQSASITFSKNVRVLASDTDFEDSCVRVVSSTRSGMGKSLYVRRMAEKLQKIKKEKGVSGMDHIIIPVHGPRATADVVMDFLHTPECLSESACAIMHFDIAPSILDQMDTILFSLLILRGLSDSQGRVWKSYPTQLYAVEARVPDSQETAKHKNIISLLELLPRVECISPQKVLKMLQSGSKDPTQVLKANQKVLMDEEIYQKPEYQRVYHYLRRYHSKVDLDKFVYEASTHSVSSPAECLEVILPQLEDIHGSEHSLSWCEVWHFVSFLNRQLECSEKSFFCSKVFMDEANLSGLKNFVVKFMIEMSRDFATSPLEESSKGGESGLFQLDENKLWTRNYHSYLFFNDDGATFTFVGFAVNDRGDSYDPKTKDIVHKQFMTKSLYDGLTGQEVDLTGDYDGNKDSLIRKLGAVMGHFWVVSRVDKKLVAVEDPDPSYVLTVDNVIKMLAIRMRFRCGIPVIIMGETGCGKTRLIRYMCDLDAHLAKVKEARNNMLILKVHGGTTEEDIIQKVQEAEKEALKNKEYNITTVLFLDEANTTEHIGLIKEVMCDRTIHGKPISEDVQIIAACNPYRKHTPKMITKLESAGLGFYVKEKATQESLDEIPLRHLVYRVHDLPPSMRSLVYDFGQLSTFTEEDYTKQIVKNQVTGNAELCRETNLIEALTTLLVCSQQYMKDQKDECSFVSLRDVVRTMIVFEYFYTKMIYFEEAAQEARKDEQSQVPITVADKTTRAIILALGVCYHARLEKRYAYEKKIVAALKSPLHLPGPDLDDKVEQFRNELKWCQSVLLHNMSLPQNVARNTALRENVFMMTICIELRIPLFLVGKPGSSKSLAKSIVTDSLLGQSSGSALLKQFKHVTMISHQCSQLSTPEGVIEVFKTARLYQKGDTVSVVVLDEVGLAEDSPSLPLKVLHPLLEDGTEHAVRSDEIIEREKRVAFIGISNWALDPAKMNRGVMVIRGDPDTEELIQSAEGICSNEVNDPVKEKLRSYFEPLAIAYQEIYRKQKELDELHRKEFYGLRDFYSLIKMLYWMCKKAGQPLNWPQMKHAILRNFGGIDETSSFQPLEEFMKVVVLRSVPNLENVGPELHGVLEPDCSPLGLIETSLMSRERSWHGENRYLLFLTENYSALQILYHYLHGAVTFTTAPGQEDKRMEPFVLFGSSFPKDKEYTQVCRNINRVKICMETGRMVILLNLENLYESLYDLLNQYYIKLDEESRYVDLGLQTHRVKCRVHNNFKLILIAEKETVFERFPIPLINRLEKHQVLTSTVLTEAQKGILKRLIVWIDQFTKVTESSGSDQNFRKGDAFVGFQKDTPAAVIFHSTHILKTKEKGITEESDEWKEEIYKLSQELLLQMATPDAVVRTSKTELKAEHKEISNIYFNEQKHSSLEEFLRHQICDQKQEDGLFMQVTTHSHLLSSGEIEQLTATLGLDENHVSWALLQEFDTELDFSNKVGPVLRRDDVSDEKDSLLIIQCDSGHLNVDLLACARYRIQDEKPKLPTRSEDGGVHHGATHVLFVINLPRKATGSSFVGFQGGQWISTHIDNLRSITSLTLADAMSKPISALFYDPENEHGVHQCSRLHGCIQAAGSRLRDAGRMKGRTTGRVAILLGLIPQELHFPLGDSTFIGAVVKHIHTLLQEREGVYKQDWVVGEAMSASKLQNGGTFLNTLARKLDDIVIPLLSEILGFIDRSYTLDLIDPQDQDSPLSQFWLKMFSNPQICQFRYNDIITRSAKEVPGMGSRISTQDFKAKMPFSWLIKATVDGAWDTAQTTAGNSTIELCSTLCTLVSETLIGEVLSSVDDPAVIEDFYHRYLNDYTRMEHKSLLQKAEYSEMEYKLVIRALDGVVHSEELSRAGLETLTSMVTAVHVAFHKIEEELFWFGQLVCHNPEILSPLLKQKRNYNTEMTLHLEAVITALESLDPGPPLESKHDTAIHSWLHTVYNSQNAIDSILTSDRAHGNELMAQAKLQWNLIQVVQMFAEHMVLKHENMTKFACRLKGLLESNKDFQDFTKAKAVNRLKNALNNLDGDLKKNIKDRKMLAALRKDIYAFFMEIVSRLCFGQETPPEPAVVKELINSVFTEKQGKLETRESLLQSGKEDKVPVIRSFLLQLLLQNNTDEVRDHLCEYFQKCCQLCPAQQSSIDGGIDQNLCLLCIKCFEDAYHKSIRCVPFRRQIAQGLKLLTSGYKALRNQIGHAESDISVEFLEGVAQVRFALSIVAELLSKRVSLSKEDYDASMLEYGADATTIIEESREACIDEEINELESGPLLYLLKLIVRQYGLTCLNNLIELRTLSWILPPELQRKDDLEDKIIAPDPFLLYEKVYTESCQLLTGQNVDALAQRMKDTSHPLGSIALLLALYCKVTIPQTSLTEEIPEDFLKGVCEVTEESQSSFELKTAQLALIGNNLVGPLRPSTGHDLLHKSLAFVVVHAGAVFLGQQGNGLLQPFVKMATSPDELAGVYLPTLPIDEREEFMMALREPVTAINEEEKLEKVTDYGGKFYVCCNGHPYFIGGCGGVYSEGTCNVCKVPIGGQNYNLTDKAGQVADVTDTTPKGYALGKPEDRGTNPFPERKLLPASCAIMRFLMHAALMWASSIESIAQKLPALVKEDVAYEELPGFFWKHLKCDLEVLKKATNKSDDDVLLLAHLILKDIYTLNPSTAAIDSSLSTKTGRTEWEGTFDQVFFQPTLQNVEERIKGAIQLAGATEVVQVAYEQTEVPDGILAPHLWVFRSHITLDHLNLVLQHKKLRSQHPILHEFLIKEPILRATQYLPDIVKLQWYLYDKFNRQVDHKEAATLTLGKFIETNIQHEHVRKEYTKLADSLQKAWQLVREKLQETARLHVEDEHLIPTISEDTPLEYLIPTTSGPGLCTTALVDALALTHNNFIKHCQEIVNKQRRTQGRLEWMLHKVPITHIHRCHLLDYEQQILSVVLSHCHYSLKVGEADDIKYDLPALEKHFLNRFIHGKPMILLHFPQVVYRKDVYTAANFATVRNKTPQEVLAPRIRQEILSELRSVEKLRSSLDVVDVVLGFLASSGGNPKKLLRDYIRKTLKMDDKYKSFSKRARDYCTLAHVMSLWEALSVEIARRITLNDQEPFDSFPEAFRVPLTEEQETGLQMVLRSFTIDQLLGTLYEFIETYIKQAPLGQSEWGVVDVLDVHLEQNGLPIIDKFADEFPDTITLGQTIAAWKFIVRYQEKQKE